MKALLGAVALGAAVVSPVSPTHAVDVELTADSTALIMGGTGLPTPTDTYADSATTLYLQPNGFAWNGIDAGQPGSNVVVLTTPETGNFPASEIDGANILTGAITDQVGMGNVPVYAFGYSQSSAMSSLTMQQLAAAPNDVHFVLVGNTGNPNGGLLTALGIPGLPSTPDGPYPTDIYTLEYDGWADFPHYALNLGAVSNALDGMFYDHLLYLGLSPDQIGAAVPLGVSSADNAVDYNLIASPVVPSLAWFLWGGSLGRAFYDLFAPETRVQIDLGYGNLVNPEGYVIDPSTGKVVLDADGNPEPGGYYYGADANDPTSVVWSSQPADITPAEINSAMSAAWQQGWTDFMNDLANPASAGPNPLLDLVTAGVNVGVISQGLAQFLDFVLG